eukprot:m.30741 g.30741  ORF g.30741 m.30741 type:complete len:413 (-) comp14625_c0_seq2:23-1261(-)
MDCNDRCAQVSTAEHPCHSWTFVDPNSPQPPFRCNCFGRFDTIWTPETNIPKSQNIVYSAKSCKYPPPLPPPPPPPGPATPVFSWNKVPVYNFPCFDPKTRNDTPFTPSDIDLLLKFPFVVLCHGFYDSSGKLVLAEDAMSAVAKQLKQKNPNIKVLFYLNSVLDWNDYRFHLDYVQATPSAWARQSNGEPCRTPGDKEFAQPKDGMLSLDFAQQQGRELWQQACFNATKSGVFDGCFADRASGTPAKYDPRYLSNYTLGHKNMLLEAQKLIDSVAPGGFLVSNNAVIPGVSATMIEGFQANQENIQQLQAIAAQNISVHVHAGYGGGCANMNTTTLPAFLIGAGEYSYFGCSKAWTFPTGWQVWYPEYDLPLGSPHGPAQLHDGVFTRVFGQGTTVTFSTKNNTGSIVWKS